MVSSCDFLFFWKPYFFLFAGVDTAANGNVLAETFLLAADEDGDGEAQTSQGLEADGATLRGGESSLLGDLVSNILDLASVKARHLIP